MLPQIHKTLIALTIGQLWQVTTKCILADTNTLWNTRTALLHTFISTKLLQSIVTVLYNLTQNTFLWMYYDQCHHTEHTPTNKTINTSNSLHSTQLYTHNKIWSRQLQVKNSKKKLCHALIHHNVNSYQRQYSDLTFIGSTWQYSDLVKSGDHVVLWAIKQYFCKIDLISMQFCYELNLMLLIQTKSWKSCNKC